MRYGRGFCYHNNLFSKIIFYLAPAVDKLSSGSQPLFHKSGIAEIHCPFVCLDGFHGCCNADKVTPLHPSSYTGLPLHGQTVVAVGVALRRYGAHSLMDKPQVLASSAAWIYSCSVTLASSRRVRLVTFLSFSSLTSLSVFFFFFMLSYVMGETSINMVSTEEACDCRNMPMWYE